MRRFTRRRREWRVEQGATWDLREYEGNKPTGMVAVGWWRGDIQVSAEGTTAGIVVDGIKVIYIEKGKHPHDAVRAQFPLSNVEFTLVDEPGLSRIRLDLDVRFPGNTFTITAWLHARYRNEIKAFIRKRAKHYDADEGTRWAARQAVAPRWAEATAPASGEEDRPERRGEPMRHSGVTRELVPLRVRITPDSPDWVVFRPGPDSREVLDPFRGVPR